MATTVLITGGAGFIGGHLVRAALERGHRVRILDDLSYGQPQRIQELAGSVEFLCGSILDPAALKQAVAGVQIIFHEAARVSVPQSMEQPLEYHEVNATGTLQVMEAARRAGVRRVVYAASSSAYGEEPELPKRESQRAAPISPYAVSKFAGELYLTVYARQFGLETIGLRYFNVFGPHQDPKSQYGAAIPAIVGRMLRGERPTVYGDGEQTRDFCYIDNVVRANLLASEAAKVNGEVVNIACGEKVTVNDIVRLTNRILGTAIQPVYAPPRAGDVRDSVADIALARKVIGYEPAVYFEQGLERMIRWLQGIS